MGILDWIGLGKDVAEVTTSITDGATDIIRAAKGELPPEQQVALEKLKTEAQTKIMDIMSKSETAFRDFTLKYEGTAEQVPKAILILRSLIRPVITILTFGWFFTLMSIDMVAKMQGKPLTALMELPEGFWWMFGIILGFWFGGKAAERFAEKLKAPGE